MSKKKNIMSLSLEPDIQDKIKLYAEQKTNGNVSKLIRDLVEKYLVSDDDVIPVILKVPLKYKGDQENLQKWMDSKAAAIVKALSN